MKPNGKKLEKFARSLRGSEREQYVRAVKAEAKKLLGNAYNAGFQSSKAGKSVRTVGDILGLTKGKVPGLKTAAGTPTGIPPGGPISPEQWMKAAQLAAWQKFPERAASVGLNPAPYPTASTQIQGQVPPSEPEHDESVVSAQRVMQYLLARFNPIKGLNPTRLGNYIEQWQLGFLRWLALAWNQIRERDDQIKAVVAKREFAVSRLSWEIIEEDESTEAKQHKEALEAAYKALTCTDSLDQNQQGGVNLLIRQMMRAIGDKFAVHEIVWKPNTIGEDGKPILSAHFRFIPLWFFENRTGQLRYLPYELALDGIPLDAGGWLITVGDGLNIATSIAYIYKQLGLRAWANFVDKYGMPFVIGKTNAAFGTTEWNQMVSAVAAISSDGSAVMNNAGSIEPLKVGAGGGSSTVPQEQFCDRMDRSIARLWRGGDLSTMSRGGSGASGALPQMNQEAELSEADSILLSEALNFYFDRWVIRYQFGASKPKARFKIIPPKDIDTAKEIAVDQFLLSVGVPLGIQDLQARYGRPNPDDKETLATPPQAGPGGAQIGKGIGDEPANGPLSLGNSTALTAAAFRRAALRKMTRAQSRALKPLADRIRAAQEIENDEQRQAALANIKKDLPEIFRSVWDESGDLVKTLSDVIGSSLISGTVEAAVGH